MASSSRAVVEECAGPSNGDVQACKESSTQKNTKTKLTARSTQQKAFLYRLKKLKKKMEIYSRQINKFNEESLSFSEMDREDSAYMKVDALQRKLLKTWEEFCRVQGMSSAITVKYKTTGFVETEYEELNKKINRLLDKSIDCFPDYVDVLTIVQRCTVKHKLPISSEEQGALSRRLFQDIIKELKRRRQGDFVNHFGSHLTDQCKGTTDPALENAELHMMLEKQHVEGEERMAKVIENFVVKQETNPQGSEQEAELEEDDKESEKDGDDLEFEEKNGFESDHSAGVETDQQTLSSFEMTLEVGKDEATMEDGDCLAVTQDAGDDQHDLPHNESPSQNQQSLSPLLPTISEQNATDENTFVSATVTSNANELCDQDSSSTQTKPQKEYSCDIIIIDD